MARGRAALDLRIGQYLVALCAGDRLLRLGFSSVSDYARHRLDMAGRTVRSLVGLVRGLASRPLLRACVFAGVLSIRKALTILPVARGEEEEWWVAFARGATVRKLEALVRERRGEVASPEDLVRVRFPISPEDRASLSEALCLAAKMLGAGAPRWDLIEAICAEYLSSHACSGPSRPVPLLFSRGRCLEDLKEHLETEADGWSGLDWGEAISVPEVPEETDPYVIDEKIRGLAALRASWDEALGKLAFTVLRHAIWEDLGFASFTSYCTERLGLSPRTVEQRVWLEKRLARLPELRCAMRSKRVGYEKAKVIARVARPDAVKRWIRVAQMCTCLDLARLARKNEERQMCAMKRVVLPVPERVRSLLEEAIEAAREAQRDRLLPWGAALGVIARHFVSVWKTSVPVPSRHRREILGRRDGYCEVPVCSRAATQLHHIIPRSHGGGEEGNLVALCPAHHLHGVHKGYLRMSHPDDGGLRWDLGIRSARSSALEVLYTRDLPAGRMGDHPGSDSVVGRSN